MQRQRGFSLSGAFPLIPDDKTSEAESLPDLKAFIDGDLRPTFIVPINLLGAIPFEVPLCNHAFNSGRFSELVHYDNEVSLRFRSWAQSAIYWREHYDFAGRTWTAFQIQGRWKCIRASSEASPAGCLGNERKKTPLKLDDETLKEMEQIKLADARLTSLYKIFEMSDVGT
jgi:hypothetical protein